jgi:hypothetical protein
MSNGIYTVGQEVTVKAIKITEGEKSHCFSLGEEVEIIGQRNALQIGYGEDDLYLCSNGQTEQYLWTSEFK